MCFFFSWLWLLLLLSTPSSWWRYSFCECIHRKRIIKSIKPPIVESHCPKSFDVIHTYYLFYHLSLAVESRRIFLWIFSLPFDCLIIINTKKKEEKLLAIRTKLAMNKKRHCKCSNFRIWCQVEYWNRIDIWIWALYQYT